MVHVIPVPDTLNLIESEGTVHRLFRGKCVNGFETFDLSPDDLELLKTVRFTERGMEVGDNANQEL